MSSNKDKASASTTKKESTITKAFTTQVCINKDIAEESNSRYRKTTRLSCSIRDGIVTYGSVRLQLLQNTRLYWTA